MSDWIAVIRRSIKVPVRAITPENFGLRRSKASELPRLLAKFKYDPRVETVWTTRRISRREDKITSQNLLSNEQMQKNVLSQFAQEKHRM